MAPKRGQTSLDVDTSQPCAVDYVIAPLLDHLALCPLFYVLELFSYDTHTHADTSGVHILRDANCC